MDYFTDNAAPRQALMTFLMADGAGLDQEVRSKLVELNSTPSIVDMVVNVGEFLFARRSDIPNSGKVLGAQMSAYRAANDWHQQAPGDNARARGIQYALMRATNQTAPSGTTYPVASDDPEPLATYAKTADPAPAPAPAPDPEPAE